MNPGNIVEIFAVYAEAENEADTDDQLIGRLEADERGYLSIAEADSAHASFLERVVERLNGKAAISLMSDAPGDAPFTTRGESLGRCDPGFLTGLRTYARTYYGLMLI